MEAGTYELPPQNLNAAAIELIRGVYKLQHGLLLILDIEKAVDVGTGLASASESIEA